MELYDYFDRIAIIHLPERTDRYRALRRELARAGIDIHGSKVCIPDAPKPADANGFKSRAVYGNFLSHYNILRDAKNDGIDRIWIFEDDAIFARSFAREAPAFARILRETSWDLCFFGHTLREELIGLPRGLPRSQEQFYWVHCYAVHARALPRLLDYFTETLVNEPGHPRGGRMYTDAVYSLFRQHHPDVVTLITNPVMSVQRGSPSSLAGAASYDRVPVLRSAVQLAREVRDEIWRWTGFTWGGAVPRRPGRSTHHWS